MKKINAALVACALATLAPSQGMAATDSSLMVRTTAIGVFVDSKSDNLDLSASDQLSLAVDATYFVAPRLAVDVLATFLTPRVKSGDSSLGSVGLVPPIFALQYHFVPDGRFRPYAGVGFNYNYFHSESGALAALNVKVDDTVGFVAQLGTDWMLSKTTSLNLDVKYLNFDADIKSRDDGSKVDTLKVNAVILGVGLGFWL